MSTELGKWLRAQRQARSWNVPEMTRQLRRAATGAGDKLPANECLYTMIRRWERGDIGVSERYMLHYCKALDVEPDHFGPHQPGTAQPATGPQPPPAAPARHAMAPAPAGRWCPAAPSYLVSPPRPPYPPSLTVGPRSPKRAAAASSERY